MKKTHLFIALFCSFALLASACAHPKDNVDVSLYRGSVREIITLDNAAVQLGLESYEGTDFGYPFIFMHTDKNTQTNFDLNKLAIGDYLQVFYSKRTGSSPPIILAAGLLPPASSVIYNGEVTRHQPGLLELRYQLDAAVFRYSDSTQFYLDKDSIRPGTTLSVLHSGVFSQSDPAQGFALEVRPYSGRSTGSKNHRPQMHNFTLFCQCYFQQYTQIRR